MQHLEVSGAVRHIYIYVIRRLKVKHISSHFCCDSTWIEMGNKMINEAFYDRHELSYGSFTAGTG